MSGYYVRSETWEKLAHCAMCMAGSSLSTYCTFSGAHSRPGKCAEIGAMPFKIGFTTIQITLVASFKYFGEQDSVVELCKTMRDVMDGIMEFSSERMRALGEVLLGKL